MERKYVRGQYVRISLGAGNKKYYPVLLTPRGGIVRYSKRGMKTATLAKTWAQRWAERVNIRVKDKLPISKKTSGRYGRYNIYFEDLG